MADEISLIVTNTVTFVKGRLKSEVYKGLKQALGYMPEDAFHRIQHIRLDPDFEKKPWLNDYDGHVTTVCYSSAKCKCAIKKKGTHFPTGVVSKAIAYFKSQYMSCKVYDKRDKVDKSLSLKMDTEEFEDREYQTNAINKACNVERGVIQAATGSGKSFIGASIIAKLNVSPFIFYVTSIDLLNQAKDELERFINYNGSSLDVGVIGDGKCNIKDINVMTIQTAVRACGMKYKKFDDEEKIVKEKGVSEKNKEEIKDLIMSAKGMIADECQHVRADSCQIISNMSLSARYRYGMSVFGDTKIEIKGDMFFERGENITIEEAWRRASLGNYSLRCDGGYDMINLSGAKARGWEKESFRWKSIQRIIRHKNTSASYMVRFAGKDSIKLTEDHSIFKINDSGEIVQCLTPDLKVGDTLLLDNGAGYSDKAESIDILSSLPSNKFRVGIDLKGIPLSEIGLNKHSYSQLCRCGVMSKKYGGSLYLSQYRDNLEVFQKYGITPKWIYTEGANGVGLSTSVSLSDFSYIIGFFLGDGWFDGSRIRFAVEESFLDTFLNKLQPIEGLTVHPKCKKMKGASFEVSISCFPLVTFLKGIIGEHRCYDKRIPKELLFGNEDSKRMLLEGLIDSDGTRKKRERDIKRNRRYVRITSTSPGMIDDIKTLLRSLNVSYTVSKREKALGGIIDGRRIVGRRDSFQIIFSDNALDGVNEKHKGNVKNFPIDCIEKKVLEIKEIPSDGYVYDLEMSGHPSFVANGVLVHNSATPYRNQGDDILIEACFGKTICNITASDLIRQNYLVKPDIYFIPISNMRGKGFGTYATAYKEGIVNNTIRNNIIVKVAKQMMDNNRVVLILCKQIKHGNILESLIPDSVFIHGSHSSKVRKKRLDEIRERKASVTIASTIFDEGINVRPLDTLILAGSGKSKTRALQRVGRILRTFPGKEEATVIDFMDNCKYMLAHSQARKKIYQTEPEFTIDELKIK